MTPHRAEVIAIGDELTTGFRLDTNTQWISKQIEELGLRVAFHTTVGDELADIEQAFEVASKRAELIISTGGLGPTADDLTRQAIARVGKVELIKNDAVLEAITHMFQNRGRDMPPNNEIQAWFPEGAQVIDNPEGTAPGIDFKFSERSRVFALPGVPAEMKQMWLGGVQPRVKTQLGIPFSTWHHTLHCFGNGESAIEQMLPELIERGRDPLVGITASAATISLRVSTRAVDEAESQAKMQPTIKLIKQRLGELVYGENGIQLEDVVVQQLSTLRRKISLFDFGLHGEVARRIARAQSSMEPQQDVLQVGEISSRRPENLERLLRDKVLAPDEVGVVIGPLDRNPTQVESGASWFDVLLRDTDQVHSAKFRFSGHSSWRETRAVKDVLNLLRLKLLQVN